MAHHAEVSGGLHSVKQALCSSALRVEIEARRSTCLRIPSAGRLTCRDVVSSSLPALHPMRSWLGTASAERAI